jgi:hypothetical protein
MANLRNTESSESMFPTPNNTSNMTLLTSLYTIN